MMNVTRRDKTVGRIQIVLIFVVLLSFTETAVLPASDSLRKTVLDNSEEYFPDTIGTRWQYKGEVRRGPLQTIDLKEFLNVSTVTGTREINGVTVTVFHETNQANLGPYDNFYRRDAAGIVYYGREPETPLEKQLVPYQVVQFPLSFPSSLQQFDRKNLDVGRDLDGDGQPEKADMEASANIVGTEAVTVPAGTFPDALRIEMRMTFTIYSSRTNQAAVGKDHMTAWLVKGVGLVKYIERQEDPPITSDKRHVTETTEELVEVDITPATALDGRGESPA